MATPVIVTTDTDAEPVVDTSNPQATHVVERDEGTRVKLADSGHPVYFPEGSPGA